MTHHPVCLAFVGMKLSCSTAELLTVLNNAFSRISLFRHAETA
jgi:hypothetical protein